MRRLIDGVGSSGVGSGEEVGEFTVMEVIKVCVLLPTQQLNNHKTN